jgi:hypothetical protein
VAAGQQAVDHAVAALTGVFNVGQVAQNFGLHLGNHLTGVFNAKTGSSAPAAVSADVILAEQQAAAAAAAQAQQTAAINSQLPHFYGGGANGKNYSVPLGTIPADGFTNISTGLYVYNSVLLTDSQTVSGLWNKPLAWFGPSSGGVSEVRTVNLRSNTGGTTYCYAKMYLASKPTASTADFVIEIGCYVAGVQTVLQIWFYSGTTGYTYYLNSANHVFAFEATSYTFTVEFSLLSLSITDNSHVSQQGTSYRSGGFLDTVSDTNLQLSWELYDSGPVVGPGTAYVATEETTTSTSYTDLATTTDQVTINVGSSGMALVSLSCVQSTNVVGQAAYMGVALSGSNTVAASDDYALQMYAASSNWQGAGISFLITNLTTGATTFKAKYRTTGGGGDTGYFFNRRIAVIPL